MFRPAAHWEYRWKFVILIASQPVLAMACWLTLGIPGPWYSPDVAGWSAVAGLALITVGLLLRLRGTLALSPEVMSSQQPDTHTLVNHDIYGATRNPLYLGTILAITGFGAFFSPAVALVFLVFHAIRYDRVVRFEEKNLHREWGPSFEEYLASVPRWIPSRLRLERNVPWLTGQSLLTNGVFTGLLVGALVAFTTGHMWTMYVIQLSGGILMGMKLNRDAQAGAAGTTAGAPASAETRKAA